MSGTKISANERCIKRVGKYQLTVCVSLIFGLHAFIGIAVYDRFYFHNQNIYRMTNYRIIKARTQEQNLF